MILAIDIGNTNITVGGFDADALSFVARLATDPSKTVDEYAAKILGVLSVHGVDSGGVEGAILSSVVPPLSAVIRDAIRFAYGVDALTVGPGIKTGLNIRCDDPSSVGADLICASVAALRLYGPPALIVDMGTATKMMVVDQNGSFIGVSIIPGLNIALKALSAGAAQLPQISLEAPKSVIGKNTADSMRSGAVFGNAAMIDGMIDRFRQEAGEDLKVLATGGLASIVIPHCRHEIVTDGDLVLKGLYLLYQKNT